MAESNYGVLFPKMITNKFAKKLCMPVSHQVMQTKFSFFWIWVGLLIGFDQERAVEVPPCQALADS